MSGNRAARLVIGALLLSLLGAARAEAGWVITQATSDSTLVSNGRLRTAWGSGSMIVSGDSGELVFVNDTQKAFYKGGVDDYCASLSKMMDDMLASAPPEQREAIAQMMGRGKEGETHKVTVESAGSGGQVSGAETSKFKISVDGSLYQEVWLNKDDTLRKEMSPLVKLTGKLTACTKGMHMGNVPEASPEYVEMLSRGFPMKIVSYDQGQPRTSMEVTRLEKRDVPESAFQVPDGYTAIGFQDLMRMQASGGTRGGNPHGQMNPHGGMGNPHGGMPHGDPANPHGGDSPH